VLTGLVSQAVGVGTFPFLARFYSEGRIDEVNHILNASLRGLIVLIVPISAITIAISSPLVHFIFFHTRLQAGDLDATAATLVFFAFGIFAQSAQHILSRGFYALHDTLTPAVVGTAVTILNLPLYWYVVRRAQHLGLALASSVGFATLAVVLFLLFNRRTANRDTGALVVFFVKTTFASAGAALICCRVTRWLEARMAWQTRWGAFPVLVIASSVGFVVTGMLVRILGVREFDAYLQKFRQLLR
jgi:putative peptidoglycan lipid II flippase